MEGYIIHPCKHLHIGDMIIVDDKNVLIGTKELQEEAEEKEKMALPFSHSY